MKSKKLRLGVTFGISILILVSALVFTDVAAAKTKVNIQAEKSRYLKKQGLYIIEGNPFIKYKDYTISADLIKYFEDDDRAIFTGNVMVIQDKTRIHAETMEAQLKTEEFVIDGNVDIYYVRKKKEQPKEEQTVVTEPQVADQAGADEVVTPETAPGTDSQVQAKGSESKSKNDVIKIRAQHVELSKVNEADFLVAKTDVWMQTDDQTITSEYLEYQGDQEVVVAQKNVKVLGKDEEELYSDEFTYWLDGEEEGFEATGGVKLEFFMKSDEEKTTDSTTADPSAEPGKDVVTDESADATTVNVGDESTSTEVTSDGAEQVADPVATPGEELPAENAGE